MISSFIFIRSILRDRYTINMMALLLIIMLGIYGDQYDSSTALQGKEVGIDASAFNSDGCNALTAAAQEGVEERARG